MSPESFIAHHNQGMGKLLGISFLNAAPDRVVAQLNVSGAVCARPDVVHGGAIMALADCASAYGAVLNLRAHQTTATIESKTNFWRRGAGPTVRAESVPLHVGRTMSVWRASVFRGEEQIAEVTQTQLYFGESGTDPDPAAAADPGDKHGATPGSIQPLHAARTTISRNFSQPVVDERWRQIFEGACAVIAEKGFAKASIRDIAAAGGMAIPTMYQYLERKEDLLYRIYEYFMSDIVAALHNWRGTATQPRERFEELIRTIVRLFDKHHKYIKVMFQETRALTPDARRRVYELDARYIAIIRELLDTAIRDCGWRERNTELAANFVYFLCCIWPLRHWTIGRFGQDAVAGEIVDFVLHGLSGRRELEGQSQ